MTLAPLQAVHPVPEAGARHVAVGPGVARAVTSTRSAGLVALLDSTTLARLVAILAVGTNATGWFKNK